MAACDLATISSAVSSGAAEAGAVAAIKKRQANEGHQKCAEHNYSISFRGVVGAAGTGVEVPEAGELISTLAAVSTAAMTGTLSVASG
ncbi:MAG: hypothetical protein WCJ21_03810, partial [Planctomycetota bacterium]